VLRLQLVFELLALVVLLVLMTGIMISELQNDKAILKEEGRHTDVEGEVASACAILNAGLASVATLIVMVLLPRAAIETDDKGMLREVAVNWRFERTEN